MEKPLNSSTKHYPARGISRPTRPNLAASGPGNVAQISRPGARAEQETKNSPSRKSKTKQIFTSPPRFHPPQSSPHFYHTVIIPVQFNMYISTRSLAFALAIAAHSAAQTSTSTTSSAAPSGSAAITPATSVNATIYPGDSTYTYYGCYNETTLINGTAGLRALSGGADETSDSMTVETCLKFCQSNGGGAFAGLEYTKYAPNFPLSLSLSSQSPFIHT